MKDKTNTSEELLDLVNEADQIAGTVKNGGHSIEFFLIK